jgi:hypothetical protein
LSRASFSDPTLPKSSPDGRSGSGSANTFDPLPHFLRESAHFGFKRLELQHESFDPEIGEMPDASCDRVITHNQSSRGAAVAAESWRLVLFSPP